MDKELEALLAELTEAPKAGKWKRGDLLSTGSYVLNCAISGYEDGGILPGEIIMVIGASESGKTAWYNQLLAEAANDPRFDDYDLLCDDSEGGNLFNIRKFWGKKLAKRLKAPRYTKDGKEIFSETIEDMNDTLDYLCNKGKPFIFIEDSVDALLSKKDKALIRKQRLARSKGKKEPQSYDTDRPKKLKRMLREIRPRIRELRSIVVLIFQEMANLGFTGPAEKKTYSGGMAPRFFSNLQLWFSVRKQLTKKLGPVKENIGTVSKIRIAKNRLTGRKSSVELPFYYDFGFDNIGSSIDFLVTAKQWSIRKKRITTTGFDQELVFSRSGLISHIEDNNLEEELKKLVGTVWRRKQKENAIVRKRRYT